MTGIFANVTTAPLVILSLLVGVVAARLAYNAARRFETVNGVAAWHLPAGLWALLFFLSWLVGLILFFIAKATTRPRTASAPESVTYHLSEPTSVAIAGWYPDPGAHHELRYWDGKGWTDYVRDGTTESHDPH